MRRVEEGMKEVKIARELDPLSMIIHIIEGFGYNVSGNNEKAISVLENVVKFYPESPVAQFNLYISNRLEGNDEVAFKAYLKRLNLTGASTEDTEKAKLLYQNQGWRGIDLLNLEQDLEEGESPTTIAVDYIVLGEYEKAIDWLEEGIDEKDFGMTQIYSFPLYQADELLQNKRYQAILKKMNFPK